MKINKIRVKYLNCFFPENEWLKESQMQYAKEYVSQHVNHYNQVMKSKAYNSAEEMAAIQTITNIEELYDFMRKSDAFYPGDIEVELITKII